MTKQLPEQADENRATSNPLEPKASRRDFAALLGAFGALTVAACSGQQAEEGGDGPVPEFDELHAALQSSGTLQVADTAANLRAFPGPANSSWVAVLQGLNAQGEGGGLFYWSTIAKPDDGWSVLNAASGNSAGWRRVMLTVACGELASTLGTRAGIVNGEVRECSGVTIVGKGAGRFRWNATSTATAVPGMILGSGTGRWERIYEGALNIEWFGAIGDDSTNCTLAIQAALNFANAGGALKTKEVFVPAGTFRTDPGLVIGVEMRLFGLSGSRSIIKSRQAFSNGSGPTGILVIDGPGTTHHVQVDNIGIVGIYNWSAWATVSDNNLCHGIHLKKTGNLQVRDVRIWAVAGSGIYAEAIFESSFKGIQVLWCARDAFYAQGGNTLKFDECSGGYIAHNRAMFRIGSGCPTISSCNGLYGIEPGQAATHLVSWGEFGDYCKPTIIGCNIEGFTRYGCTFGQSAAAEFISTSFQHTSGTVVRALSYYAPVNDDLSIFSASCRFTGGPWGNPDTQTADGYAVQSNGVPCLSLNASFPTSFVDRVGNVYELPRLVTRSVSYLNQSFVLNRCMVQKVFKSTRTVSTSDTAATRQIRDTDHELYVDSSAGPVTVSLPYSGYETFRELIITKVSTDNHAVTIDPHGGETVNGVATIVLTTPFSSKRMLANVSPSTQWVAS